MKNSLKMKFYFIIIIFGLFIYFSEYANCFGYSSIRIDKEKIKSKLFSISIPFIENKGLFNNKIAFYTKTFGGTVYITKNGNIIYVLPSKKGKVILKEIFINNEIKKVRGEIKSTTKVNYIYGKNLKQWITNLSTYDLISLNSVWKGIKVKIKAYGNKIEKLFYIYPGSEAEKIKIKVEGAKKLYITKKGKLNVKTPKGNVYFTKPIAYQEINGKKKFVKVSYVVKGNIYSFKLGKYDKTKPVIIDPLLASTYLGSNGWDFIITMTTDSAGNVYVAGYTNSSDFPVTSGVFNATYNGGYDGFISKLSSDLSSIIASTYIGGSGNDFINTMAIDSAGNIYIAGYTDSSNFPITSGGLDPTYNGGYDGFISKLNSNLSSLLASTYLGGANEDYIHTMAIDSAGNIYAAGYTASSDLPITSGSFDPSFNGGSYDGFICKLNSNLSSLLASTYLGGANEDYIYTMAIDSAGNIYAAGYTDSSNFPVTSSSFDPTYNGIYDGFISKLSSNLSSLLASTYIGGSDNDFIYTMAIDSAGNIYAAGHTASFDFPQVHETSYNGLFDGFVSKLNSILSTCDSVYIRGSSGDFITVLSIDPKENIYVAGYTYSFDFPINPNGFDTTYNDANLNFSDSFIAKVYNSTISDISSENSSKNEDVSTNNNSTNTNKNTTITIGCYMNPHAPFTLDLCMLLGLPIIYFFIRRKKNLS